QACREDLCVLVHGIEGSNQDMQIWQERLQLLRPEWHLLLAASISQTCRVVGDGIDRLGELLAREVLDALKEFGGRQVRLHFVGHSLGGLVARAALPLIAEAEEVEPEALEYGHFVSLNSPHLGVRSGHPFTCWKNLGDIIPQRLGLLRLIHQVTLQDREELTKAPAGSSISSSSGRGVPRPFLEELADPTGAPSR
ncbi:Putative lipase YDL109C, partial [Durusdinium trenchii]